ncbi:MAG: AmmeMemoRadiSam system protein B [Candidatus Omnitrophica bacterium]|nr:AmmeMemoRadiSam system protein B [Candidatus Omnitrophota bacterium]
MNSAAFSENNIKKPNVSGQFYSSDPKDLADQIDQMMKTAVVDPYTNPVEIIIAPHAGYYYSGAVAAHSFKAVSQQKYNTIIVLAPSHFYGFEGISVWSQGGFETPLGVVNVDEEFAQSLTKDESQISNDPKAFIKEHALEVEIPFLQRTFKDFKLVPVIIGQPSPELLAEFAQKLNQLIGTRDDVLVVVSSDLSHYHDDSFARIMDLKTIEAIKNQDIDKIYQECRNGSMEMCGCLPVVTSLLLAKARGLTDVDVLKYANSGDVNGKKDSVVGYSSIVIYKKNNSNINPLTSDQKKKLISMAKEAIRKFVGSGERLAPKEDDQRLLEKEGAFVSIYKNGQLRGCIGNIIGRGPLYNTVINMAISAASKDHRFTPIQKDELDQIQIEISVLSTPRRIMNTDEIRLGTHGVIVSKDNKTGVFLPQVADSTGWSKEQFLSELCSQKAGLPRDCWKDTQKTIIEIFSAEVFSEKE